MLLKYSHCRQLNNNVFIELAQNLLNNASPSCVQHTGAGGEGGPKPASLSLICVSSRRAPLHTMFYTTAGAKETTDR